MALRPKHIVRLDGLRDAIRKAVAVAFLGLLAGCGGEWGSDSGYFVHIYSKGRTMVYFVKGSGISRDGDDYVLRGARKRKVSKPRGWCGTGIRVKYGDPVDVTVVSPARVRSLQRVPERRLPLVMLEVVHDDRSVSQPARARGYWILTTRPEPTTVRSTIGLPM